ncbi:hypothetical protein GCM10009775_12880 [Microbacterium aoyamense]|uniref:Uncharacterized protein n=1 Tax=Microbacterium aoyamense TaxID=344166 RepID=A0ABN2PH94_9MICO|nr:hypothetical protein [Microbacterium aoyamense]
MLTTSVLVSAAVVLGLLMLLHSCLGERFLIVPLSTRDDLPPLLGDRSRTVGVVRFAWHITSVLGLGFAAVLVDIAAGTGIRGIVLTIGITCFACAVLPLLFTRGRHPSWVFFLIAGGLCVWVSIST